jgi:peptidoglycan/xylan/chitin deacetylase (PgdA/CDA1 family)
MIAETSAILAVGTAAAAWAVRSPRSALLAPSVYHGQRDRPAIALTFDDGPSEATPGLLELLDRHRVKATFFQCGASVDRLPSTASAVSSVGHDIGNHTYSHAPLWFRGSAFIHEEVSRAQRSLQAVHGRAPLWFRAPYGVRWPGLAAAQRQLGLTGVMWTALGLDWKLPAEAVAQRLLGGARNGAIFCLHDGRVLARNPDIRETIETVRRVVPELLSRGFRFETVTEILCPTNSFSA